MKKINVMALAAMLIGGGLAYATQINYQTPNTYLNPASGLWEDLNPEMEYKCNESIATDCVGFRTSPSSNPVVIIKGKFEEQ